MTTQEIQELQAKIKKEMQEATLHTWCLAHGIDPKVVTYEDGKICIHVTL